MLIGRKRRRKKIVSAESFPFDVVPVLKSQVDNDNDSNNLIYSYLR